jgi:hypothetical protein
MFSHEGLGPSFKRNRAAARSLQNFPAWTGCHLQHLSPDPAKQYEDGKGSTNSNGQCLVLAMQDAGERDISPGELFFRVSNRDQVCVSEAGAFAAPHDHI